MKNSLNVVFILVVAACVIVTASPRRERRQLDKDNKSHRGFSDSLDNKFGGNKVYENYARPVIHGTYHAGRYVGNGGNPAEWARAKDQFSKVGTGQQRTEYLKAHQAQHPK